MTSSYDAFISYKYGVDQKLARAVRAALHGFARPWYRLRALNVFLDQSDLAADPRMWSRIQESIGKARFFLLMASPEAAASPWVQKEVDQWFSQNSPARPRAAPSAGTKGVSSVRFPSTAATTCSKNVPGVILSWIWDPSDAPAI